MKKLLAVLVCVALVAMCFSFAGCKKKEQTIPAAPGTSAAPAVPEVPADAAKAAEDAAKAAEGAAKAVEGAAKDAVPAK